MKWLLLSLLVTVLLSRKYLLGDLWRSAKALPKHFADGKKRIADPASMAKPTQTQDQDKDEPPR